MKLTLADNGILVVLSRRNLEALLVKLDEPDSHRTIFQHGPEGLLVVKAEENDPHYKNREPPGQMSDATEAGIKARSLK